MYYAIYTDDLDVNRMLENYPNAVVVGEGAIDSNKLAFSFYGTLVPSAGSTVPCVVVDLRDGDAREMRRGHAGKLWQAKQLSVTLASGGTVSATGYVLRQEMLAPVGPSALYLEKMEKGYEQFAFDKAVIRGALAGRRECAAAS